MRNCLGYVYSIYAVLSRTGGAWMIQWEGWRERHSPLDTVYTWLQNVFWAISSQNAK